MLAPCHVAQVVLDWRRRSWRPIETPLPLSWRQAVCTSTVVAGFPPPEISMLHRARTVTECQEALGAFPGPLERYGEQIACANWLGKAGGKAGDGF